MNEQIKALLLNARNMFVNGVTESNNKIYIHGSEENLEKFAELIVQECASKVDFILRERRDGGGTMGDKIREHFGVEE